MLANQTILSVSAPPKEPTPYKLLSCMVFAHDEKVQLFFFFRIFFLIFPFALSEALDTFYNVPDGRVQLLDSRRCSTSCVIHFAIGGWPYCCWQDPNSDAREFGSIWRRGRQCVEGWVGEKEREKMRKLKKSFLLEFVCHCMVKANKLAVAMVTNRDYPRRIAFEVMQDVAKKWEEIHPNWASTGVDQNIQFPHMEKVCKSYEDPRKSDNILKIQNQLDETKDIMIQVRFRFCEVVFFCLSKSCPFHQNIESILARGESIQDLVDKTDDLESSSKVFFNNADKLNSCWGRCNILWRQKEKERELKVKKRIGFFFLSLVFNYNSIDNRGLVREIRQVTHDAIKFDVVVVSKRFWPLLRARIEF